jgi:signal transduction histidine kinase
MLVACSGGTPNGGASKGSSVDTAFLRRQIDSIDVCASRGDTSGCRYFLRSLQDPGVASQLPLLVFDAYFCANNVSVGAGEEQSRAIEHYLATLYSELRQLANEAHSQQLQVYADYLPARRLSNLGRNAEVLPQFLSQLERFTRLNDKFGEGLLKRRVGLVYFFVYRQFERSASYFKEALAVSPDEAEKTASAEMLVKVYFCLDNEDSLNKYRQIQHRFAMWSDTVRGAEVNACYYILGYIHGRKEWKDSADKYVSAMLNFYERGENTPFNDLLSYAPAYSIALTRNRLLDESGTLIGRLEMLTKAHKRLPNNSLAVYDAAVRYNEARGDLASAYRYLKTYLDLSHTLRLEANREQTELARIEYEASKRENAQRRQTNLAQQQTSKFQYISLALIINSVALILLVFFIIRQSRLRRRLEAEKLRNRLSRDLHDDIGSTLSSINILSRTAQRNLPAPGDERVKASLEKISERSQRLLDSMSDIIWNIQTDNDTLEELLSRMRDYAAGILEAKNIAYTFDFPLQAQIRLSMDTKSNLYLIFKEAVNNLAKYSGCTAARMSLTVEDGHIVMEISDNGRGFDPAALQHSGGLRNMQHRATEMKGMLSVTSATGDGTHIVLHAPLQ